MAEATGTGAQEIATDTGQWEVSSLSLYLTKYLSTECSGWCFFNINLYSNCSSFDRKNRAHFSMCLP